MFTIQKSSNRDSKSSEILKSGIVRQISNLSGNKNDKTCIADDAGKAHVYSDEEKVLSIMNTTKRNNLCIDDGPLCLISSGRHASEVVAINMINARDKETIIITHTVCSREITDTMFRK